MGVQRFILCLVVVIGATAQSALAQSRSTSGDVTGLITDSTGAVLPGASVTDVTDTNSVFGLGAFPSAPLPSYGQPLRGASPRQAQLAARRVF